MSLRGKEVRPFIDEILHEQLSILAEHADMQPAGLAARLLEKAIVGEWHEFRILIERAERCGKRCKSVEVGGKGRG